MTVTRTDASTYTPDARTDFGIWVGVYKVDSLAAETLIYNTNPSPDTATSWSFPQEQDGYHKIYIAVADDYDAAATYANTDVVFFTDNLFYQANQAVGAGETPLTNPEKWDNITNDNFPSVISNEVDGTTTISGLTAAIEQKVLTFFTDRKMALATVEAAKDCCSNCKRPQEVEDYEFLAVLFDAMGVAEANLSFLEGEKLALKANEL
jgi:hypothetical protein